MFDTLAPMVPIMLLDNQGRFIYASDAFLNDMGLPPEALRGKTAHDLVREGYYERSPSLKALAEGRDSNELCASRDGKLVFTETRVLRDSSGDIQYVLCHSSKPADIQCEVERLKTEISAYKSEIDLLRKKLSESQDEIVFESAFMRNLMQYVDKVAKTDISVMLTGESGVGKDLIARAIHDKSDRADNPFIPICIPVMSPTILESELFGYVEGRLPTPRGRGKSACLKRPMEARSSWTRWAISRWRFRSNCCEFWRAEKSPGWGAQNPRNWISASCPLRIKILKAWPPRGCSEKICSIGSACSIWKSNRCASGGRTLFLSCSIFSTE
jgi:PAS domain S-box-containing protein